LGLASLLIFAGDTEHFISSLLNHTVTQTECMCFLLPCLDILGVIYLPRSYTGLSSSVLALGAVSLWAGCGKIAGRNVAWVRIFMAKYQVAWLPGDGVGRDVMQAARVVLDRTGLEAEYLDGDIGWECWCQEGDALPARTIELLGNTDCAMFGAITSKPRASAERELHSSLQGKGFVYRSPIVRIRQLFDLRIRRRPA